MFAQAIESYPLEAHQKMKFMASAIMDRFCLQPSITVQRYVLHGGELAVVEVFPSLFLLIIHKGVVWIRIWDQARLSANEAEELRLIEERAANTKTFDVSPVFGSTLPDINVELFKLTYLPNAIDSEILAANHREIKTTISFFAIARFCK